MALLTVDAGALRTLLLRRSEPPQRGRWALPGGFVRIDESLETGEQQQGVDHRPAELYRFARRSAV